MCPFDAEYNLNFNCYYRHKLGTSPSYPTGTKCRQTAAFPLVTQAVNNSVKSTSEDPSSSQRHARKRAGRQRQTISCCQRRLIQGYQLTRLVQPERVAEGATCSDCRPWVGICLFQILPVCDEGTECAVTRAEVVQRQTRGFEGWIWPS